jgi:YQGE family putative transporter
VRNRLNPNSARILVFQSLFNFGNSFSALFVNIYLWRLKSNLQPIAIYNFCAYFSILVFSLLCGKIIERRGEVFCLRTGISLYTVFYLTILSLGTRAGGYLVPLGFLSGLAAASLFMGFNTLIPHLTPNEDRDFFFGVLTAIAGLGAIVIQPSSGYIINHFSGLRGYSIIFSLTLGLFLTAIGVTFLLKPSPNREVFHLTELGRAYQFSRPWRGVGLALYISAMRGGIYSFLITILVYIAFKNEWGVGKYSMVMSAVSLTAALVVGRTLTRARRIPFYFVGTLISFIAALILVAWSRPLGFILYGLLFNASTSMRDIPNNTISYEVVDDLFRERGKRFTYVIGREIPIGLGRLTSILFLLVLYHYLQNNTAIKVLIPTVAGIELLNVFVFRWIKGQRVARVEAAGTA